MIKIPSFALGLTVLFGITVKTAVYLLDPAPESVAVSSQGAAPSLIQISARPVGLLCLHSESPAETGGNSIDCGSGDCPRTHRPTISISSTRDSPRGPVGDVGQLSEAAWIQKESNKKELIQPESI